MSHPLQLLDCYGIYTCLPGYQLLACLPDVMNEVIYLNTVFLQTASLSDLETHVAVTH